MEVWNLNVERFFQLIELSFKIFNFPSLSAIISGCADFFLQISHY